MHVNLTREVQRDRTYVAVSVPEQPILASIVLPDGRLASDAGADIRICCSAALEEPDAKEPQPTDGGKDEDLDATTGSQPHATGGSGHEGTVARRPLRRFGKPRRLERGVPPGAWRTLPIKVHARLDGFETLAFEYRLGDPLPVRCLRRSG